MDGCLLSRALLCCCCVLVTKPKEKGLILMENLKEEKFVDLKAIERPTGGGVKTAHMRMILEALAQVEFKRKLVYNTNTNISEISNFTHICTLSLKGWGSCAISVIIITTIINIKINIVKMRIIKLSCSLFFSVSWSMDGVVSRSGRNG